MSHACVGMPEASMETLRMPTQAWSMAPVFYLAEQNVVDETECTTSQIDQPAWSTTEMNNHHVTILCGIATAFVILIAVSQSTAPAEETTPTGDISTARLKVDLKAKPFPLSQVRLADGYSKRTQQANRRYLQELDPDRLLHSFRVTARLPSEAKPLGGWESPSCGLRGHFVGHYLSACAQMYAATGDAKMLERANHMVDELAECQAALGTGYLSAFPTKSFDVLEEKFDAGVWAPYYTIHKIMAGLLDVHVLCGNQEALAMAEQMADYFQKRMDALPAEHVEKILRCDKCNPVNEYGGMGDVMHDLYAVTGKPRHLRFAHLFDRDWFLGPLIKGEDKLTNLHCNTHIPIILGAARHHELTGKKDYRAAVVYFWDRIANTRSYATGNNSGPAANPTRGTSRKSEHWGLPNKLAGTLTGGECESCAGHNMLKLTSKLFTWTAEAGYADFAERLYYNTVLNHQNPETGMLVYHQPLGSPCKKHFGNTDGTFWCCYGTGVEAFAELPKDIYFHDEDTLWVNLYVASQLSWPAKGLRLNQTTDFPESDRTRFVLHLEMPSELAVNLRIPYWANKGGSVTVNGKKTSDELKPNTFHAVKRTWQDGDTLELSLPMSLHTHAMPDDANMVAVMAGPVVLAALTDGPLTYKGTVAELLASIKPVEGKPLTFTLQSNGKRLTFKPLYRVTDDSYGVYFKTGVAE